MWNALKYGIWNIAQPEAGSVNALVAAGYAPLAAMVLASRGLPMEAVEQVASIDLKAGEAGLLSYSEQKKIPIRFYTAEELGAVPGEFTTSAFVSSVTGVDNVCERAAARNGDPLIVRKTACRGVTVAVSRKKWEVTF